MTKFRWLAQGGLQRALGTNGIVEVFGRIGYHKTLVAIANKTYVATPDLKLAVNAALTLTRPLLVKGEPGTGKTLLARPHYLGVAGERRRL